MNNYRRMSCQFGFCLVDEKIIILKELLILSCLILKSRDGRSVSTLLLIEILRRYVTS